VAFEIDSRYVERDTEAGGPEEGREWRMMRYMVVIERGEASWGAHVPDLPGCVAVGETSAELLHLISEAMELHIDGLKQDGLAVPAPSSEGEIVEVGAAELDLPARLPLGRAQRHAG
jgi:predicted RNase H-like HicB family nuclease